MTSEIFFFFGIILSIQVLEQSFVAFHEQKVDLHALF